MTTLATANAMASPMVAALAPSLPLPPSSPLLANASAVQPPGPDSRRAAASAWVVTAPERQRLAPASQPHRSCSPPSPEVLRHSQLSEHVYLSHGSTVGRVVGTELGLAVGLAVIGDTDGASVGLGVVGGTVGDGLGDGVGNVLVGGNEGPRVGPAVVGRVDGAVVGGALGELVSEVGAGVKDGVPVGLSVEDVGDEVTHTAVASSEDWRGKLS